MTVLTNPLFATLEPRHWEPGVGRLLDCLNPWLVSDWRTQLVPGRGEPLYLPAAGAGELDRILFAHGFFNSALHELAHWCVAGERRRRLEDYGYWYCPDGRDARQQAAFEAVEVKPQALEWWFTAACGRVFRTSTDNLAGEATDSRPFRESVQAQALAYAETGLPPRAERAVQRLSRAFHRDRPGPGHFSVLPAG